MLIDRGVKDLTAIGGKGYWDFFCTLDSTKFSLDVDSCLKDS